MMEAKDFRIGNWVLYKKAVEGSFDCTTLTMSCFEGRYIESMFKPVPLTEQWLFNFGFEIASVNDQDYLYYTDKEHLYYLQIDMRRKNEGFSLLNNCVKELETITIAPIEYVHQLQNLYFALTGEELKFKLKL